MIKHQQNQFVDRGSLILQLPFYQSGKSGKGLQARNMEEGSEAGAMEVCCLLAWLQAHTWLFILILFQTTYSEPDLYLSIINQENVPNGLVYL